MVRTMNNIMNKLSFLKNKWTYIVALLLLVIGGLLFAGNNYKRKYEKQVEETTRLTLESSLKIQSLESLLKEEQTKRAEESKKRKYTKTETKPDGTVVKKEYEKEETKKTEEVSKKEESQNETKADAETQVNQETTKKEAVKEEESKSSKVQDILIGLILGALIALGIPPIL